MNFFYNSGIAFMRMGINMASVRHKKARLMVQGQANTFQYLKEHLDGESQYMTSEEMTIRYLKNKKTVSYNGVRRAFH